MTALDPDSAGVGKQTMLDWLRINHPKEVIRCGLNKAEIADIVRQKQPDHHKLSHSTPPSSSLKPSKAGIQSIKKEPVDHVGPATSSFTGLTQQPSTDPQSVPKSRIKLIPGATVRLGKRVASSETAGQSTSKKRTPGRVVTFINASPSQFTNTSVKCEPNSELGDADDRQTEFYPLENSYTTKLTSTSSPIPKSGQPYINPALLSDRHTKHHTPPMSPRPSSENQSNTLISLTTDEEFVSQEKKIPQPRDLMEFSDLDLFETENTLIGRDIPSITNTPRTVSGVDIFLLERQREEKVLSVEESINDLKTQVELANKNRFDPSSIEDKQITQDEEIKTLRKSMASLQDKLGSFDEFKKQFTRLNNEVIKLRKELGEAFKELQKQEEIITKLIQMGEEEEEDDYEEEDSS
ncbi:hypothetical protein DFH28DRAFT_881955 [Melampsora americana]|nr:hypothetical protein DFH28DRAFT_881955 [Melampsora americana]